MFLMQKELLLADHLKYFISFAPLSIMCSLFKIKQGFCLFLCMWQIWNRRKLLFVLEIFCLFVFFFPFLIFAWWIFFLSTIWFYRLSWKTCGLVIRESLMWSFFQDSSEVHSNAAETLCAVTRFAPPGLLAKISSPR